MATVSEWWNHVARMASEIAASCSRTTTGLVTLFFFFQAEAGIRDYKVTGVQTCALPICLHEGIHLGVNAPAAPRHRRVALVRQSPRVPVVADREHVLEPLVGDHGPDQIGRASCRERV